MTPNPTKLSLALPLAVLAAAAVATVTGDARAQSCGMGDIDWYGVEHINVSRADELLRQGEPQKAASLLQHMWPELHDAVPVASSIPVIADGVRLMALAAVRSDGNIKSELGWSSWTPRERSANVAWGVRRLRMLAAANPYSLEAKTDLGEALARSPSTREEGRDLLEDLDSTRSIATAEGYAALAFVRSQADDTRGAELAGADCIRTASNVAAQCASIFERDAPIVTAAR
jgi:hypothetical protein